MRRLVSAVVLLGLSVSLWASTPKAIDLSFVQTAPVARLTAVSGKQNEYRLILGKVSPYITYYTRRPGVDSGLAQLDNFLKAWKVGKDSFAKQSPNATLFAGAVNDRANSADSFQVVTLSNPVFDKKKNELEYTVVPLKGQHFLLKQYNYRELMLVIN